MKMTARLTKKVGEVGLPLQSQDVDVTGPLFTEGVVVDMAGNNEDIFFKLCIFV